MEKDDTDKKVKEGKKAARAANKTKEKNDTAKKAAKKGQKALLDIAADVPMAAGGAKTFLKDHMALQKLKQQRKEINLAMRGIRGNMKGYKIELRVYDHVVKLSEMEPEDSKAFRATEALYTESLGFELSPEQKQRVEEINRQREEGRKVMNEFSESGSGKEVGSGATKPPIGHNSEAKGDDSTPSIPAKNEEVGKNFVGVGAGRIAH